MKRAIGLLTLTLCAGACASAPPAPTQADPTFAQKMAWMLRLEDRRQLREPAPPPAPPVQSRGRKAPVIVAPPPPPDLLRLLEDTEARVRRRAALAVGRVGLPEGVGPLVGLLADSDPEVRQMAAFALGLLADPRAKDPLVAALGDSTPLVRASAAEALGQIGDLSAADAIGRAVAQAVQSGSVAQPPGEDVDARRDVEAAVVRLGVAALARLKAYDALAAAVLDGAGQPRVRWWPVAAALRQIEDPRALPALRTLAKDSSLYTRTFAIRGLGALKDRSAVPLLVPLATSGDRATAIEAVRALGQIGDPAAAPTLQRLLIASKSSFDIRLEAIVAAGNPQMAGVEPGLMDALLDAMSDPSGAVRAAATGALAALDPQNFVLVLSGLDPDPDWRVRSALATTLGLLPPEVAMPRLTKMLGDQDQRVIPAVLASMAHARTPNAAAELLAHLKADDPMVRAAAAAGLGDLRPDGGLGALTVAYETGQRDTTYVARAAAVGALAAYGAPGAPFLRAALADKDWAVRARAASLLKADPAVSAGIRPAPTRLPPDAYGLPRLTQPAVSTAVYIDTDRGTIQIELAVLDAPLTVENFVTLARGGFFDGLTIHRVEPNSLVHAGDPRGDGEGGPGYTIRDELNERPFLRGTVGMAREWPDAGGSQFFIAQSPHPERDGRFTAFGRIVAGMDVVDAIQPGDVIRRVRVWDGVAWGAR